MEEHPSKASSAQPGDAQTRSHKDSISFQRIESQIMGKTMENEEGTLHSEMPSTYSPENRYPAVDERDCSDGYKCDIHSKTY